MSFLRRKSERNKKGEIDHTQDPLTLKATQVKQLNKKVEFKSHFVGVVNLADGDFSKLLINTIESHLKELKPDVSKNQVTKPNDTRADCEKLIDDDESESEDEDSFGAGQHSSSDSANEFRPVGDTGSSSTKQTGGVLDFNFSQVTTNCLVPGNPDDPITASLNLIKKLLNQCHWFRELDMDGTYLFKALLPTKQSDFSYRIQHWLTGLIVVTNHQYTDPTDHFNCLELAKKLNELRQVLRQAYVTNNFFQKSKNTVRQSLLIFMNPAGECPEMCPANPNLENVNSPCLTCLELKTNFECRFASDLTAAFTLLVGQDVYKIFPEIVRVVNMQLSGLY